MKRFLYVTTLTLALAGSVFAQQKPEAKPAEATPTVDQVLDKFVQAIGGKAAVEKLNSRIAKGTFEIPSMGVSGTTEMFAKAPGKNSTVVDMPGFGTFKQAFDGKTGWSQDPMNGLRDMSAMELAAAKIDEDFYRDIRMKELYPKIEIKGKAKVGERDAYLLEAPGPAGSPDKFYFDAQSGLLLKTEGERDSPQGKAMLETFLEDYKEIDGVKLSFTIRINNPAISFTIKLSEVKHNVPVDDSKFVKPAAQ